MGVRSGDTDINRERMAPPYFCCSHVLCLRQQRLFYLSRHSLSHSTTVMMSRTYIEPVMFARCAFIFVLQNIALGGYLDARRNI